MRRAVFSMAAAVVLLASFATPGFAQRGTTVSSEGSKFRMSATISSTQVDPGDTISVTGRITTFADGTTARQPFRYALTRPDGSARTGVGALAPGRSKTLTRAFTVPANTPPGEYEVNLTVQWAGELQQLSVPITVGESH